VRRQIECAGDAIVVRAERYVTVMETVTDRVRDRFRSNMKKKGAGWSGTLEMNAKDQELIIKVSRPEDVRWGVVGGSGHWCTDRLRRSSLHFATLLLRPLLLRSARTVRRAAAVWST